MSASVGSALRSAFRIARRHKKAVLSLYLLNVLVALALLPGLAGSFDRSLGQGDYRQKLVRNLDLEWLEVLRSESPSSLAGTLSPMVLGASPLADHLQRILDWRSRDLPWSLLAPLLLFWLLNSFLSGAALGSAALDPAGTSWREFLRTGAEFWSRFLRLGLFSLASFGIVHSFLLSPLTGFLTAWAFDRNDSRIQFWVDLGGCVLILLAFGILHLVFSFSRVIAAAENRGSMTLAVISAAWFCWKRSGAVILLMISLLVPVALWISLRVWLSGRFAAGESRLAILYLFLFLQLSLLAWMGLRFWYQVAQMQLFRSSRRFSRVHSPRAVQAPGESPDSVAAATIPQPDSSPETAAGPAPAPGS